MKPCSLVLGLLAFTTALIIRPSDFEFKKASELNESNSGHHLLSKGFRSERRLVRGGNNSGSDSDDQQAGLVRNHKIGKPKNKNQSKKSKKEEFLETLKQLY